MTIPTPPPDNSGGYMILQYHSAATSDTHRMRIHLRPFDATATYTGGTSVTETTVPQTFTALAGFLAPCFDNQWTFTLVSIFRQTSPGVFTEIFGWTVPAAVVGSGTDVVSGPEVRADQLTMTLHDGFGGIGKIVLLGTAVFTIEGGPSTKGGNPAGDVFQKLVDYLTTATKTNAVSHNGHILQSPAHLTTTVNRRLLRAYKLN